MMLCRESGDARKSKPYLPQDKQYLVTRNGDMQKCLQPALLPPVVSCDTVLRLQFLVTGEQLLLRTVTLKMMATMMIGSQQPVEESRLQTVMKCLLLARRLSS